jgi:hypothetical protein
VKSKEEAEEAVVEAYREVTELQGAIEHFAQTCSRAHAFLSDGEIAKLIDYGHSRSRIQQWRQEDRAKEAKR